MLFPAQTPPAPSATDGLARGDPGDCFDEQTVLDLIGGRLADGALPAVVRHLAACDPCTDLLGVAAKLVSPGD